MKHILFIFLALLGFLPTSIGQNLDEEIGFKYVKAEYLLSTERMEDAISELNDIIKASPFYKDALILRAQTKYKLGAFKGAKDDVLMAIENNGVTVEAATLLGKTEYALGNRTAAINSLSAAIAMDVDDERVYELRANIHIEDGNNDLACEDWSTASDMGSTKAAIELRKNCAHFTSKKNRKKNNSKVLNKDEGSSNHDTDSKVIVMENDKLGKKEGSDDNEGSTNDDNNSEDDSNSDNTDDQSTTSNEEDDENGSTDDDESNMEDEEDENLPKEDNTENNIEIDEELSLSIYGQGLGKRRILDRPSILILSDKTGKVAVEICVNENGKVDYAEFNPSKSSLTKNSLVSLAIRKSKEFWFEKSDYKKQCGYIIFDIKGSE